MNLQELVTQIAAWNGGVKRLSSLAEQDPQDAYKTALEREFLMKGSVLLKRYQQAQERLVELNREAEMLKSELLALEKNLQQTVDLGTGDQISIDLARRPEVMAFWQEVRKISPAGFSLPQIVLEPVASRTPLYDRSFLAQESDDLLSYL